MVTEGGTRKTTVKTVTAGSYLIFRFNFKTLTLLPVTAW